MQIGSLSINSSEIGRDKIGWANANSDQANIDGLEGFSKCFMEGIR